jgi:hypothetical protein
MWPAVFNKSMSIGIASEISRTERGLSVRGLSVRGSDVPGRWVIIDRRFVAVENAAAVPRSE